MKLPFIKFCDLLLVCFLFVSSACKNKDEVFEDGQKDGGRVVKKSTERVQGSSPPGVQTPVEVGNDSGKQGVRDAHLTNLLGLKGAEFDAEFKKSGDPVETAAKLLAMTEAKKKSFMGYRIGLAMKEMPTEYVKIITENMDGINRRKCLQVFVNLCLKEQDSGRLYEAYLAMDPGETRIATAKTLMRHDYFKVGLGGAMDRISQFLHISEQRKGITWLVDDVLQYEEALSEEVVINLLETAREYGASDEVQRKFRSDERTSSIVAKFEDLAPGESR